MFLNVSIYSIYLKKYPNSKFAGEIDHHFSVLLCSRNDWLSVAYLQKKIPRLWPNFSPHSVAKPPEFWGPLSKKNPSQGDYFSVLFCSRNHGSREAYSQIKKIQDWLHLTLFLRPRSPNFWGPLSKNFTKSKASFFGHSLLKIQWIPWGLFAEKNFQDPGLIIPLIP